MPWWLDSLAVMSDTHFGDPAASSSHKPLLLVRSAVKKFGNHVAVDGLDLAVNAGEIVSLLGPNGAGKTTTIEMCEGFQRPDSGSITVFGQDPFQHSDEVRSRIGVMLQGGGAYPGIRVGEMIELVASYSANPLDPDWLLKLVGLDGKRKTTYRRLSGGQQQRLALACALVGRPELVFLDEPTAGLDAQSRAAVWDIVQSLRRDGVGVVLTTHLLDEAEALSDRVYIVDKGKVIAHGTPEQLTQARNNQDGTLPFQVCFADDVSPTHFQRELEQLLGDDGPADPVTVTEPKPRQLAVAGVPVTPDGVLKIATAAQACGATITKLDSNQQSLEEVFLALTGREMRS